MRNANWIQKIESELEYKKVIMLYGNTKDFYYYDGRFYKTLEELIKELNFGEILDEFFTYPQIVQLISSCDDSSINSYLHIKKFDELLKKNVSNDKKILLIKNPELFFEDFNGLKKTSLILQYFQELIVRMNTNIRVIFIANDFCEYPESLYKDNAEMVSVKVELPDDDLRLEYIRDCAEEMSYENLKKFLRLSSGRSLKEIAQILDKGQNMGISYDNAKEFFMVYDYKKRESPWEKLDDELLLNIDAKLKRRVLGQDHAIDFVKKVLIRAKLGLSTVQQGEESNKPIGTFFFVGPSGVGKTELAKTMTELLFNSESEFKRFDMSEYKEEVSINKFIGSAPGYVGYEEGGQLTNWVQEHPFSLILFDEIEKAHPKIWDTFLQILEDGRLTDNRGNTVYFKESILVFTSNIGNKVVIEVLEGKEKENLNKIENIYKDAVREYFVNILGRVEILNRIGNNIVVFNQIDNDSIYREIINEKLKITKGQIEKKLSCTLIFDNTLVDYILRIVKSSGEKFGGRAVVNVIESNLINEFAVYYLENKVKNCHIKIINDEVRFNEN